MAYFYLLVALLLNACANVILKVGAEKSGNLSPLKEPLAWLRDHVLLIGGMGLFAFNVLFYFAALRHIPLSTAYPILLVGNLILVNGFAIFALKEPTSFMQWVGYLLLLVGIVMIFWFAPKHG